ncbi:hypothetical protein [Floccifex sp.]|uniref:hypothetical protein n=1 Tax=Floccifex sp. TaxID=2815810 RepID=UPI002A75E14D|nr:hypothetical protein [Floccifex sp.]MDD7280653.1 hypothetical protein [Erysipelotrichaceae bacterium]MDY2958026.1 hypothetical protein [Floccifex sp.]
MFKLKLLSEKTQNIISNGIIVLLGVFQITTLLLFLNSDVIKSLSNTMILNVEAPISYLFCILFLILIVQLWIIKSQSYFKKIVLKYALYLTIHFIILFSIIHIFDLAYNVYNGFETFVILIPVLFIIYILKRD